MKIKLLFFLGAIAISITSCGHKGVCDAYSAIKYKSEKTDLKKERIEFDKDIS